MILRLALLVPILALPAACAGDRALPQPSGPWRALNAGQWVPAPDDLRGPRLPLPPVLSPNAAAPAVGGAGA